MKSDIRNDEEPTLDVCVRATLAEDLQFRKQTKSGTTHSPRIYYGVFFQPTLTWQWPSMSCFRFTVSELMIDKLHFLVISKLSL
jgi:hypothetical protein